MFENSEQMAEKIMEICENVKAEEIVKYDVRDSSQLADFYVICSGNSDPHLKALKDKVDEAMSEAGVEPTTVDSAPGSRWIIMDYSEVILHIFHPETRAFYKIEELWKSKKLTPENLRWECPESEILNSEIEEYSRPDANEWF